MLPTLLIQNAHNGRYEFVVVQEGRCGVLTIPMGRAAAVRELKRLALTARTTTSQAA